MNRPIKFRAWDTERKMWVADPFGVDADGKFLMKSLDGGFYSDIVCKHRFIICQYTGLKDKNGVEIYEGDIIDGDNWEVVGNVFQHPELASK